jgi:hypothetical protein
MPDKKDDCRDEQPVSLKEFFIEKLNALALSTELSRSALATNTEAARMSLEKSLDLSRLAQEKLMVKLEADIRELREDKAAAAGSASRMSVNIATCIAVVAVLVAIAALFLHH